MSSANAESAAAALQGGAPPSQPLSLALPSNVDASEAAFLQNSRRMIQSMSTESRQRIVAGQAISDLASCVKELVDNALDAGSKSINIRLFNKGLEIVEVSDDGDGIPKDSRAAVALPHATSKIQTFADIYDDQRCNTTLGFRGEALHSLANISAKLVIATRTSSDALAQKMEYRRDGTLVDESVDDMPRKVGTTVAVLGLLQALPVRRRDLEQRIAHHRTKLVQLVTEYAIFSVGVRINLMDIVVPKSKSGTLGPSAAAGKEKTLLATTFNSAQLHDTVSSVLGTKFLQCMSPLSIDLTSTLRDCAVTTAAAAATMSRTADSEDHPSSIHTSDTQPTSQSTRSWTISGLIQAAGVNRDKAKGQFFSINRRPVDLPKVARLLNESFRAFGGSDRPPACVLEFTLPGSSYDINLSPDKRQVLLTYEEEIHCALKVAVEELWASQTDGQFLKSMDLDATTTTASDDTTLDLDEVEAERCSIDIPIDDRGLDEMGDSSSSCRLFARRYGFVHDPNMAEAKEQDEIQRRVEYESNSPRAKRRKSSEPHGTAPSFIPTGPSGLESPSRVRRRSAMMNYTDESMGSTSNYDTAISSTHEPPHEVSMSTLSSSSSTTTTASTLFDHVDPATRGTAAQFVTPSVAYPMEDTIFVGRENQSNMQSRTQPNHFLRAVSARASSITPCAAEGQSPPLNPWSEQVEWQNAQSRFNRSHSKDDLSDATSVPKKISAPSGTEPPRRKSFGLERFGFRHVAKEDKGNATAADTGSSTQHTDAEGASTKPSETTTMSQAPRDPESKSNASTSNQSTTPSTHWSSFQGTQEVVMASLRDRIHALERKRQHQRMSSIEAEESDAQRSQPEDMSLVPDSPTTVTLSKDDFKGMIVLGQFNLGFILARSQNGNLWILDQHACDEKYNFEKLCRETVIHEQTLISPMPLELSPSEETCILDHMEVFKSNGFRFQYDETKPPRHRLSVTALPHSGARDGRNAVQYGKDDILALCTILGAHDVELSSSDNAGGGGGAIEHGGIGTDGSGRYGNNAVRRYAAATGALSQQHREGGKGAQAASLDKIISRLPKTIAMFASRACRGSIMIGTALSDKEMDKIVKRLADIEHPWNCPHGRPTLRHVCDVHETIAADHRRGAEHIAGPTVTLMTQDVDE